MLNSMRNSKNRYFYHILVSPGDAPGAITLNVVWMERELEQTDTGVTASLCIHMSRTSCQRQLRVWETDVT